MLDDIKILLNIGSSDTSQDTLLALLIDNAIEFANNYTHRDDIDDYASSAILAMVVYDYNRIGTEGLASESLGGVNFNYSPSYPDNIMNQLRVYRKLRIM